MPKSWASDEPKLKINQSMHGLSGLGIVIDPEKYEILVD